MCTPNAYKNRPVVCLMMTHVHNMSASRLSSVIVISSNITKTTRMPVFWGYPPPPHDYPCYWFILDPKTKQDKVKVTNLKNLPKLQIFQFWTKFYMQHTWSFLIRCVNIKWIWWVLWKIQSGHHFVYRWTDRGTDGWRDRQSETSIPPFNFVGKNQLHIKINFTNWCIHKQWVEWWHICPQHVSFQAELSNCYIIKYKNQIYQLVY